MCQNFILTGRIVQNVVEIIILFVFFPTITSKYLHQLSEKTLFYLSALTFQAFNRDPHFQKNEIFLCFLEPWGLLLIKFRKSSNDRRD